jgi:hypothetical protein
MNQPVNACSTEGIKFSGYIRRKRLNLKYNKNSQIDYKIGLGFPPTISEWNYKFWIIVYKGDSKLP